MVNKLFITSPYAYPWAETLGKFASLLFLILLNSVVEDICAPVNDIILFYYFLFSDNLLSVWVDPKFLFMAITLLWLGPLRGQNKAQSCSHPGPSSRHAVLLLNSP